MPFLRAALRVLSWSCLIGLAVALWHKPREPRPDADLGDGWIELKDLAYRDGPCQRTLDLFLPASGERRTVPALLAIHGGSWLGGSKAVYGPQVARLARHGYAVAVPDYQLARPGEPAWPGAIEDLREAVRWLRRHASEYGVDPGRIAALGSGAGGHLALLLGTDPPPEEPVVDSARVQAVVDLYGPTDLRALVDARNLEHDPVHGFLGGSVIALPAAASPLARVAPGNPPILIIHGLDDLWVPPDQSRWLVRRLAEAGVPHRLLLLPVARHGFEFMVGPPTPKDLVPEILDFLEDTWGGGHTSGGQAAR